MSNGIIEEKIFDEELLKFDDIKFDTTYEFDGVKIPRVTKILAECEDQSWLIDWASKIGYKKRQIISEKALEIGSFVHATIEKFLKNKFNMVDDVVIPFISKDNEYQAIYSFNNFKYWIQCVEGMGYKIDKIVGTEIPVTCPWYGGTIDCIMTINGANYIVDFKTSSSITLSYLLQISAYMWIINNGYCPELPRIDGIGIIRIPKNKTNFYEDIFLNSFIPEQNYMIEQYQRLFANMVSVYYRNRHATNITNEYNKNYKIETCLERGIINE